MASPTIFSGSYTKLLTSGGVQMQDGTILQNEGPINYIKNYGAEVNTTGWATYADAAGNVPVDGTGGTATGLTFSRSTSSPLVGSGQFSMVQANSTSLQGKGVSYDFTIDPAYKASVLSVRFNFNASSTFVASDGITAPLNDGTTSTNAGNSDIEVFIYDVTNSVLIPVSPQVITGKGTNNYQFNGTFQTSSNSTSYRLIFHVATTSANATGWTFLFDRVYVGPQNLAQGTVITDWQTFTPTGTWTTNTTYTGQWRRVGNMMQVNYKIALSGAPSGTLTSINLPSGYTIDTSKLLDTGGNAGTPTLGFGIARISGSGAFQITHLYGSTTTVKPYTNNTAASSYSYYSSQPTATIPATFASGDYINGYFEVPILGWSSNVQMSNDTSSSVVAARGYRSAALSGLNPNNTSVKINLDAANGDTNGAWDTANSKYVIPVSGWYQINCAITINSTNVLNAQYQTVIYKNGSLLDYGQSIYPPSTNGFKVMGSYLGQFVAGDYLELYLYGAGNNSASTLTAAVGATNVYMEVQRVSGPSTIAVTDTVACRYYGATTSLSSSSSKISFPSKAYDTTGSFVTDTFTAPVSGKYSIAVGLYTSANTLVAGGSIAAFIYKNGSALSTVGKVINFTGSTSSSVSWYVGGYDEIQLVAGDTISIYGGSSSSAATLNGASITDFSSATTQNNYVEIKKIGN